MKLVLDSSVLIAASISRAGVCAALLEDVLAHHELIVSDFILDEVCNTLRGKFGFPPNAIAELRRFLRHAGTFVEPAQFDPSACRDPQDIPILGTAIAGHADLLISVDKDLLDLGSVQDVHIVKPGDYWRRAMS